MVSLFLSDMDGTLLNSEGVVSEESVQLLNRAIKDGKLFSVATARGYDTAAVLMKDVHINVPAVLLGGAVICNLKSGYIYHCNAIPPDAARDIAGIFIRHGRPPLGYFLEDPSSAEYVEMQYIKACTEYDEQFICECKSAGSRLRRVSQFDFSRPALYFTAMDTESNILPIYEEVRQIGGCTVSLYPDTYHSGYCFLDIYAGKASKADGARRVMALIGAQRLITFGDSSNDLPMLRISSRSVCVAEASDEVKAVCDETIGSHARDAVAKYIYDYPLS